MRDDLKEVYYKVVDDTGFCHTVGKAPSGRLYAEFHVHVEVEIDGKTYAIEKNDIRLPLKRIQ